MIDEPRFDWEAEEQRIAAIEESIRELARLIQDQDRRLELISERTEGQYNLLAGRLDRATKVVATLRREE